MRLALPALLTLVLGCAETPRDVLADYRAALTLKTDPALQRSIVSALSELGLKA